MGFVSFFYFGLDGKIRRNATGKQIAVVLLGLDI
jgi:hypothetical protein